MVEEQAPSPEMRGYGSEQPEVLRLDDAKWPNLEDNPNVEKAPSQLRETPAALSSMHSGGLSGGDAPPPSTEKEPVKSLKETADAISQTLLNLSNTTEEHDFVDEYSDSIGIVDISEMIPGMYPSPSSHEGVSVSGITAPTSNLLFLADEERTDDLAWDDFPRGNMSEYGNGRRSPPSSQIGFEALPPSPQKQKLLEYMEPWEAPQDVELQESPTAQPPPRKIWKRPEEPTTPLRVRLFRGAVCAIVVVVVVLSIVVVGNDDEIDRGVNTSPAPAAFVPLPLPTPTTPSPSKSPTGLPNLSPDMISPTMLPTENPAQSPTESPVTMDFESESILEGSTGGARLGRVVSINNEGTLIASFEASSIVQVHRTIVTGGWVLHSTIEGKELELSSIDIAALSDGTPILSMASINGFHVMQYINGEWINRGQDRIDWLAADATIPATDVSSPVVSLSSDGERMATASLSDGGSTLLVQIWQWAGMLWVPLGQPVSRNASGFSFLSLSLDLAGNGEVFAIGAWRAANSAANVEAYQWDGRGWVKRGIGISFVWGPSSVALTVSGNVLAITTPPPGNTGIYEWTEEGKWRMTGGKLSGGSSIDISNNGCRVVVGSSVPSTVLIYDREIHSEEWQASSLLSGEVGTQYAASVAMESNGNIICVGSPLDDWSASNAGRVYVYE